MGQNPEGIKEFHQYQKKKESDEPTSYQDIVRTWHKRAQEMRVATDETRIMRWSYSNGMYRYFNNPGEAITDANPYMNIIDLEEFNLSFTNHPLPPDPPAFNNKNRLNFFGSLMDEYVDEAEHYKTQLTKSFERIMSEAKGHDLPQVSDRKKTDLEALKREIFGYAKSLGFVSMGVTKLDRRFSSIEVDDDLPFDNLILLGYEMPKEVVRRYPNPMHDTAAYYGYSKCAEFVHPVADFIRSQGYDCRARDWEGFIKYSPHAVNAGMGNFSTYGICHTPEVGTRLKYCSILIDAELPLDEPRDFNIEEFCARCRMCQKSCPSGAIPKEEGRYRGTLKRTTHHIKCFEAMATLKECVRCIRVCPISMIGHEKAMDSLPHYYRYNLMRTKEELSLYRQPVAKKEDTVSEEKRGV